MRFDVILTPDDFEADDPCLALRRHTDRCFFRVEEVVPHADGSARGFLVDGVMIAADEVAELRRTGPGGGALPACET
ncbi:MAG: hypothetical protein AAF086_06520 [Planctomycetota bacterium]